MTDDECWANFLDRIRHKRGTQPWTAREAFEILKIEDLPRQVRDCVGWGGDPVRSLGRLMADKKGWSGGLCLEGSGSKKSALRWRVRTLDEALEG